MCVGVYLNINILYIGMFIGDDDVNANTELTIDYGFGNDDNKHMHRCYCGADNCNGFIDGKKKR